MAFLQETKKMTTRIGISGIAVVGLAAVLAGCGSASAARSEPTNSSASTSAREHDMAMTGDTCPMHVSGTTVVAADVEGGAALAFTTHTGDVAELRESVRRMAEMHNRHHAAGGMRMVGGATMPAATASAENVDGGARLVLRPSDPTQLRALREHARMQTGRMAGGECPMMSPRAQAQVTPPPSAGNAGQESAHHESSPGM